MFSKDEIFGIQVNRLVAFVSATAALVAGLLPIIANTDWHDERAILIGIGAMMVPVTTWLLGWQKHEARQAVDVGDVDLPPEVENIPVDTEIPPDEGDAGLAGAQTTQAVTP